MRVRHSAGWGKRRLTAGAGPERVQGSSREEKRDGALDLLSPLEGLATVHRRWKTVHLQRVPRHPSVGGSTK